MEPENKDDAINTTDPAAHEAEQPVAQFEGAKKKSSKKRLLLLLLLLVLLVAAVCAYFIQSNKTTTQPATQVNKTNTIDTSDEQPAANPTVFDYQLGSKILSYNVETKDLKTLTAKLPANAQVLDIFNDGDSWRAYYQVTESSNSVYKVSAWFIEQGKSAIEVYAGNNKGGGTIFAANAEAEVFAYSELPNYTPDTESTTRTYVVQDGKTDEVWKSKDSDVKSEGHDNALYNVRDISKDGEKLLFGKSTCYQCDGPLTATAFELDIASGKDTKVFTGESAGFVEYANDEGYFIHETEEYAAAGPSTEPADMTLKTLAKVGGDTDLLLSINTAKWNHTGFSEDGSLIYTSKTSFHKDGYANGTSFTGIYNRTGNNLDSLKKLKVKGLTMDIDSIVTLTAVKNDCYGTVYYPKSEQNETQTTYVGGVLCLDSKTTATFTQVGDVLKQKIPLTAGGIYVE